LPRFLTQLAAEVEATVDTVEALDALAPAFTYPPLSGIPREDSDAEQALERALRQHDWARGRHWNHTYEWHALGKPYRLDLFWPAERVVVEVDGPEHRGRLKFADDRRRDVQLQLLGHDVLRFTNEQVLSDVHAVVLRIARLLRRRRAEPTHDKGMREHVDR
jgi:very-short-patch-repair endonuclease